MNRFRQLKEEEKKKKISKALPAEEVQALASEADSDEGSDEETKDTVSLSLSFMRPYSALLLIKKVDFLCGTKKSLEDWNLSWMLYVY